METVTIDRIKNLGGRADHPDLPLSKELEEFAIGAIKELSRRELPYPDEITPAPGGLYFEYWFSKDRLPYANLLLREDGSVVVHVEDRSRTTSTVSRQVSFDPEKAIDAFRSCTTTVRDA
jgi:hypothetical protein